MADEKVCPSCSATYAATVVFCPEDGTVLLSRDGDPLVGQVIADRYRVIARIGEGGMGQVYLAEHVHMRRRCAIKFLNPDLVGNEFALKRFMREAENASRIDHPNVVTMYDFGEAAGGAVYLAMEFVDGESLRKLVEREGVLPTETIATIIRQTASALQAAHKLQIVHRDLKPDNIMLLDRGDDVRVKVVDFGIAKAKDPRQKVTVTGAIVGTPDYMSPEQVTGDEVDGTSDQYALALVAVKMLTGKLPFAATTGVESLTSRLFTEPMTLRTLRADVAWPQRLQDVINRALSPKPAERYESVTEFAKAFDKALSAVHGAVAATVPEINLAEVVPPTRQRAASVPTKVEGAARSKRPPTWLMAASIAVVAIGGGSLFVWQGNRQSPPTAPYSLPLAPADSGGTPGDSAAPPVQQQSAQTEPETAAGDSRATEAPHDSSSPVRPPDFVAQAPAPRPAAPAPVPVPVPVQSRPRDTLPTSATRAPAVAVDAPVPASTTPVTAEAPRPALMTSAEVSAEIARVRPMMTAEAARPDVEGAIAALGRMLPKVGQRSDSIRILYSRAQAEAIIEDLPAACRSLAGALGLAAGTRLEEAIARTSRDLSCQ